jgi:hypothetical protein
MSHIWARHQDILTDRQSQCDFEFDFDFDQNMELCTINLMLLF